MKISKEELHALLGLIGITEVDELNCEEFLANLPSYLESIRTRGLEAGEPQVLHHLKICPECLEEFEGLLKALNDGIL